MLTQILIKFSSALFILFTYSNTFAGPQISGGLPPPGQMYYGTSTFHNLSDPRAEYRPIYIEKEAAFAVYNSLTEIEAVVRVDRSFSSPNRNLISSVKTGENIYCEIDIEIEKSSYNHNLKELLVQKIESGSLIKKEDIKGIFSVQYSCRISISAYGKASNL